jgi:hypothetical protein
MTEVQLLPLSKHAAPPLMLHMEFIAVHFEYLTKHVDVGTLCYTNN